MSEHSFDARLSRELTDYGSTAVQPIDAGELATGILATAGTERVGLGTIGRGGSRLGWPMGRTVSAALIVLALAAAAVGVAVVAGRLVDRMPSILPHPATSDDLLVMMDMRRDPQDHACVDGRRITIATGAARPFLRCGDQVEFTRDGNRAAVGGLAGLTVVDTRDGSRLADLPTGAWTRPVGWSPSGRWIQTAECTPLPGDICQLWIVAADGSTRNQISNDVGGRGYAPSGWAPDESRLYLSGGLADPDGSNARPAPPDDLFGNGQGLENWTRSPDGTPVAIAETRDDDGTVWVRSDADPGGRKLTTIPDGHAIRTLAWSPDARTIAAIESVRSVDVTAAPLPVTPDELRLIDVATGASRIVEVPRLQHRQGLGEGFEVAWSPDGRRLAITMGNGEALGSNDRYSTSFDTVIVTVDGSAPAVFLRDARGVAWSPDGRSMAYIATTGAIVRGAGEPTPPAAIVVVDADGSNTTTVVAPADLVNPLGESSPWFVWAAAD